MREFLQTYGSWIVFSVLLLLMVRMHSHGGGMGRDMGSHNPPPRSPERTSAGEEPDVGASRQASDRHAECH